MGVPIPALGHGMSVSPSTQKGQCEVPRECCSSIVVVRRNESLSSRLARVVHDVIEEQCEPVFVMEALGNHSSHLGARLSSLLVCVCASTTVLMQLRAEVVWQGYWRTMPRRR